MPIRFGPRSLSVGSISDLVDIIISIGAIAGAKWELSSVRERIGGRGTGHSMRTLVAWGFDTLNLNRIFLRVYADNTRAVRCYEKVGFQTEGRLRQDDYRNSAYRDTLIMAILRRGRSDNPAFLRSATRGATLPPPKPDQHSQYACSFHSPRKITMLPRLFTAFQKL